jgi:hypothetical protein
METRTQPHNTQYKKNQKTLDRTHRSTLIMLVSKKSKIAFSIQMHAYPTSKTLVKNWTTREQKLFIISNS